MGDRALAEFHPRPHRKLVSNRWPLVGHRRGNWPMGTASDPLNEARKRLRRIARREPWPLRLIEPERRPFVDAFLLGLAAGGLGLARRWIARTLRKRLSP